MPNFTADWIVEGSFQETLRNLIAMADPGIFAGMSPEQITKALIDELRFISVYDEKEEKEAEAYLHQREKYCHEVITQIALQLRRLGPEGLRLTTEKIAQLEGAQVSASDLTENLEVLAVSAAARMVSHPDVTDVVGALVSLMAKLDQEQKKIIASIVTYLLPFNYAPEVIRDLSTQMAKVKFGLVEDKVSTRTLAEVIMAGYDGKPVEYASLAETSDPRGKTALDYLEGPVEGPGDLQSPRSGVLRAARNFLSDLVALKDTTLVVSNQMRRLGANDHNEVELLREINAYATRLRGSLKALSTINKGRTVYCVLSLPEEPHQREFRKQVLREVAQHVPQLVFVSLGSPEHDREFELQEYMRHIQAYVIPL